MNKYLMTKIKVISHPFQVIPVLPDGNTLLTNIGRELVSELSRDLQHAMLSCLLGFRFIKDSAATLSQANGNTMTALIEISGYYKTDLFEQFSGELMQALMAQLPKARIHWAKGFQFMPQAKRFFPGGFVFPDSASTGKRSKK